MAAEHEPVALRASNWARWPADASALGRHGPFSPTHWPGQDELLHACQALAPALGVVLILVGLVYLLFGFSMAKVLVTLNAGGIGAWVGAFVGQRVGGDGAIVPGAVVCGLLAATAAWPTLKGSVAVLGGLLGLVLGVVVWRLSDLDPTFGWSGGLTGLTLCGLLSLLLFRPCVITYTSLQGASMVVFGLLVLVLKHDEMGPSLTGQLTVKPFLLPMAVFVPTLVGYVYQQAMTAPVPVGPPPPPKK